MLIRHGETEHNKQNRFQARVDIPLNAGGVAQAEELAAQMEPSRWARVYSSDLARAVQTANILAAALGLLAVEIPEFTERSLGVIDGISREVHFRQHPEDIKRLRCDLDFAPPLGETRREVFDRFLLGVAKVTRELGSGHDQQAVLIVTHGGLLDIVEQRLSPHGQPSQMLGNCRGISLLVEVAEAPPNALQMGICHRDVTPDACEADWPPPRNKRVFMHTPSENPRGASCP